MELGAYVGKLSIDQYVIFADALIMLILVYLCMSPLSYNGQKNNILCVCFVKA